MNKTVSTLLAVSTFVSLTINWIQNGEIKVKVREYEAIVQIADSRLEAVQIYSTLCQGQPC